MGSTSPQKCGFKNRFTVIIAIITFILFIGLCCTVVESKRSDNDLVFDDSTFSDDKLSAVNTNHENLRTKLVSKRSVSDPSDNNENAGLWWRLKRGIKNIFGYKEDEENHDIEVPKVEELKALPAVIPAQKSNPLDEVNKVSDNGVRKRRQHDEDDDEDEDDEDNEIDASGENETTSDNEVKVISFLPDVENSKHFRLNLLVEEPWTNNFSNQQSEEFKVLAAHIKSNIEAFYKEFTGTSTIMATLIEVHNVSNSFWVSATINLAADLPKINGNDLRDAFYNEITSKRSINGLVVDENGFSLRALEEDEVKSTTEETDGSSHLEFLENPESQEDHDDDDDYEEACDDESQFKCFSAVPKCIPINQRCDGIAQCTDRSDEDECSKDTEKEYNESLPIDALEYDFEDNSNDVEETTKHVIIESIEDVDHDDTTPGAILEEDGPPDNDDETNLSIDNNIVEHDSDEILVPIVSNDQCRGDDKIRCGNSSFYICAVEKCDGTKNCPNGEDEVDCIDPDPEDPDPEELSGDSFEELPVPSTVKNLIDSTTTEKEQTECGLDEFNCDITRCIPYEKVCDGTADCTDKTDENTCPEPTTTMEPTQPYFGYDISNYTDIHWEYGSLADLENLIKVCKRLGIKLILDFVPNHTSNEHPWFLKSEAGDEYYKDFYVWSPGKVNNETGEREPPSNWNSLFRFSAWEWSEKRQEYYLHQCIVEQPDLNYRNPNVVKEMKNVLLFWLNRGIDGFRIDAIPYIFETQYENGTFPDEPKSNLCDDVYGTCYLNHIHTKDLEETYNLVYDWRDLLENYTKEHGGDVRILMTEAYTSLDKKLEFYGNSFGRLGSQIPFNFEMIDNIKNTSTPEDYKTEIDNWLDNMPRGSNFVPNWVVGNHDQHRVVDRFGINRADSINMMVQTLPGIAITYYGDEIGMSDEWISFNDTVDQLALNMGPENYWAVDRDPARTPFQWDNSAMAGFSTSRKTWLPVNDNYKEGVNVKDERLKPGSHLNVFKKLVRMRKNRKVLQDGSIVTIADDNLLLIKRETSNQQLFTVLNFGTEDQSFTINDYFVPLKRLFTASVVSNNAGIRQGRLVRSTDKITIPKDAGIVLE